MFSGLIFLIRSITSKESLTQSGNNDLVLVRVISEETLLACVEETSSLIKLVSKELPFYAV